MRFANLEPERMSEAQKRVHDAIAGGPRGGVRGPFGVLLRSPELADRVQKVGEHLRFNSSLPARLNEFAILINAQAVALLGEQGVVDLIGVSGYYTLVSMVLNVADIPLPAGVPSPW